MLETRRTTCNRDCPDACGIVATVEDGRITRIQGDPDHPVTRGALCYRTSRYLDTHYSPERLTSPLIKRDGVFTRASWDEALDLIAANLLRVRAESGPAAIFHYRSAGSLGMLKHLSEYLFEQFGPVTNKRGDICSGGGDAAQILDFGDEDSHDLFDLLNAKNILIWGKNVVTSSPHTLPVLKEARAKGTRLMLIDPVHHKTANHCDDYLQIAPSSDFSLAMAVAGVLFARGWIDPDAPKYCDHFDAFRRMAESKSLEAWCKEADVSPDAAVDLASRLGPGKPTAMLVGWGMARRTTGGAIVRAIDALSAISGNIGIPGGGVSYYFKRKAAYDLSFVKNIAPRSITEPLMGPQMLAMRDPPLRAAWIAAGNPVVMLPESETIVRALKQLEFLVVVDPFLTDTAQLAHVVLPARSLLEEDDLLGAYGHHYLSASKPVVPPPEGVKSDLEILQALAPRLGLPDLLEGDARTWKERIIAPKLAPHGVTVDQLENRPVKNPLAAKVLFADRKFPTATGKINLICERPPPAPRATAEFPLQLLSLSTEKSQASQWAKEQEGPAKATIHPDAAKGLADGAHARLESAIGSMVVQLVHDSRQRKDVVLVPKGGHLRGGRCANALIRARLTDLGEGGALYDEYVRLVPIA